MTPREKKTAAGLGLLALIAAALMAKGAKADDGGLKITPRPSKRKPKPKGPGSFVPDEDCPPGSTWSEALGRCIGIVPAEPGEDPTVVVNRYLIPHPPNRTGGLYQIRPGDNPTNIVRAAIRGEFGDVNQTGIYTPPYVAAMAVHSWNLGLYSTIWEPDDPDSADVPSQKGHSGKPRRSVRQRYTGQEYDPEGVFRRWYIGDAFFGKHKHNLVRLRSGDVPVRNTDWYGQLSEGGNHYGLLWLPKLLEVGQGSHIVVEPDVPPDLAALAPNIYG